MSHDHHNHSPGHKHQVDGKNLVYSIGLNLLITVAQVVGGILSGSLALLSDALHNFSDVLSLVFSFIAHQLAKKKATPQNTFGYKRAELIAAFVNAATLIIVAFILIYGAIERFFYPQPIQSGLVIWLALLGIVLNGVSVLLLQKDSEHNLNMKSAYLHLLTDMMASVAVLVGGLLMQFFGWFWVDSLMTIIIAIYLIVVGADLLQKSTKMLMLFTPDFVDLEAVVKAVQAIEGVEKLHHIHLWSLNEEELHLEAHIDCSQDMRMSEFNVLLAKIEDVLLHEFHINHVTLQPEFQKEEASKDVIVQD